MPNAKDLKSGLVFPHQLFWPQPLLNEVQRIVLIEDSLFFYDNQYPAKFHKQRLILHRASMKQYESKLIDEGIDVDYYDIENYPTLEVVMSHLSEQKEIQQIWVINPVDFILEKRLRTNCRKFQLGLTFLYSPHFLNTKEENEAFFKDRKRYFMADFYQYQRKKLNILMTEDGEQPIGEKWSFDAENRKKLPKKLVTELPGLLRIDESEYVIEARTYVELHFGDHYGQTGEFNYPITHEKAEEWLHHFLEQRFENFGPYEDAIVPQHSHLYHSVLTPMMNIGLLTPEKVIEQAIDYAESNDISLPSVEGFIRQIIGWREFMRSSYEEYGVKMRTNNYWGHEFPMPSAFYDGTTGIEPIDDVIKRLLTHAYTHHIERLMVLGGFMFICRIHPNEIYKWFMEMFIDAYDWVMVPNVYAMSQNSAGGLITTKPYFSGSNYIRKMSHYGKGSWCDIWDGLYWKFIFDHSDSLAKNPRWAMMVSTANRMKEQKKQAHMENAHTFLKKLHQVAEVT